MCSALDAGADWLIIDAGSEYEVPNGREKGVTLRRSLEEILIPDTVLGYPLSQSRSIIRISPTKSSLPFVQFAFLRSIGVS